MKNLIMQSMDVEPISFSPLISEISPNMFPHDAFSGVDSSYKTFDNMLIYHVAPIIS